MISIIIPAYNEEKTIGETISVLESFFGKSGQDFELVVVSDGSVDQTYEVAKALESEQVRVFSYPRNKGKGHALKYGFEKSGGDRIVFFDAGLDFPPKQILDFLDRLESGEVDLVVGSKRHPDSEVDYPFNRRIVSFMAQILVRILFDLSVSDSQAGLKVFRRGVLDKIVPRLLVKRYAFDIELLALAQHYGFRIVEAPVTLHLKFSTAASLPSIRKCLIDALAVFYRLRILKFYDLPQEERKRMLREYPVTAVDKVLCFILGDPLGREK